MAVDLTTIFGSEIKVVAQPRQANRQLTAFAGAHGLVSMNMGTRGRLITVYGRISYTNSQNSYWVNRAAGQAAVNAIESYQWADGFDYTYGGEIFYRVIFEHFELVRDHEGKAFHHANGGCVFVNFIATLRSLV
ncbi:MAG: hypothetical protein KAT00_02175 [Planctomycetes bacterium]|nr:hypothetical protein [Planctomycetota bacterium]